MRLIRLEEHCYVNADYFVVLRHGKDCSRLMQSLDQPLVVETIIDIVQLALETADLYRQASKFNGIKIYSSPRIRALQTADVLQTVFANNSIASTVVKVEGLREMGQGHFIIKGHIEGTDYVPLVDAWKAFQERLSKGDILYRFGDPLRQTDSVFKYPAFADLFNTFGENQLEFSLRLYPFLKHFLSEKTQELQIIVAHQAIASRIQKIVSVLRETPAADSFEAGDLSHRLERLGKRISIELACGLVILKPYPDLSMEILEREILYLRDLG